ncbi:glycosyltransferase family 39 protein [Crocinitomix sp.]|nr:glycosyltransferase family 39 protein [Crocinitomix sp.]
MNVHFFNKDSQNGGFLLITVGLFILLFVTKVFQHGLFFDGLIYSSISNNLSEGLGSFWQPHFSETIYPQFYEHPPLVFGMEAFFMKMFNGSFYAEKLFSLLTAVFSAFFIGLIWRKISFSERQKQLFWLPILFWLITPKNAWAFSNNLLENSLTLFTLTSIYFLFVSINSRGFKHYASIALVAGLFFSAFLSKGFPGLFPLGFFFLYWVVFSNTYSFKSFLLDSLFLVGCFIVIVITVFYFNAAAQTNFLTYFDSQVMDSITGENRVGSRLVLMKNLLNELLPILIIAAILFIAFRKKIKTVFKAEGNYLKYGLFFY